VPEDAGSAHPSREGCEIERERPIGALGEIEVDAAER
jgi:hypothetical protein